MPRCSLSFALLSGHGIHIIIVVIRPGRQNRRLEIAAGHEGIANPLHRFLADRSVGDEAVDLSAYIPGLERILDAGTRGLSKHLRDFALVRRIEKVAHGFVVRASESDE